MTQTFKQAIQAEALKVRRSAAARLPWVGLALSLLQGLLFLLSPAALQSWRGLTAWQTLWITFLLPLFLALLAGLTAVREVRAGGAGLWWRPLSWDVQARAELFWLGLLSLALNAGVVLPTLLFGKLIGLSGEFPWLWLCALWLTLWVTSLPLLALGQRISRRWGLVASLMLAFLGDLAGIYFSERASWWLCPWAWPIRATFTLSGTAANGVPLTAESPLWQVSAWPVVAVSLLVVALLAALPYALPRASEKHAQAGALRPWRWNGLLASELVKYRYTSLPWLILCTPCALALLASLRGRAASIWEVWTLLVVPFAAALLAAIGWGWEREAWRTLQIRAISTRRLYWTKLLAMWLAGGLCGLLLFGLMALIGKPFAQAGFLAVLYALTLFALLSFHLWLAARWSTGATLGVGIVATLLAAILGGTGLGGGIWPFFPWIWARVLPEPDLAGVTVWPYLVTLLALGGLFGWLGERAAVRD